ncbi:MAG: PQQ-binding-like beta-propeller repeat protein [Planctomycetota bacterium]
MGAARDGVYRETGIVKSIQGELPIKWRQPIGGGYAGPAVADGKVFVFDYQLEGGTPKNDPGSRVNLSGKERLLVLDQNTGRPIWEQAYDCPYSISYPAGPRCTPTVDGDRVYTLGSEGDLKCFKVSDGTPVWSVSFKKDFSAEVPIWGFAAHPLVDGDLLYTMVGGVGQGVVAFDKMTGKVRFKALDCAAGYCPPSIIQAGGTRQLIVFHPQAVCGLDPKTGTLFWSVDIEPSYEMSITRPMVSGNRMYVSGIRTEALMLELGGSTPSAKELWRGGPKNAVHCANSTPLFVDGVIYGTDCNIGNLIAVDASNGEQLWTTFQATIPDEKRRAGHGTAFLTRIGESDRYLIFSEVGDLLMANLTREGFKELGRTHVLEPSGECFGRRVVWSHPAYADQTAYIRNDKEIVAVDLKR